MDGQRLWNIFQVAEHVLAGGAALYLLYSLQKNGVRGILKSTTDLALAVVPGASSALDETLEAEVNKSIQAFFKSDGVTNYTEIPAEGLNYEECLNLMRKIKNEDIDPSKGKLWAYVYDAADGGKHKEFIREAQNMFMDCNGLNPMVFPSLRHFENDVIAMSLKMLHGPPGSCGIMTSGGTESLLMAVKTYRDMARALFGITEPELICPATTHPGVYKACHYFGVKLIEIPVDGECRGIVSEYRKAITKNTVVLVASAPSYPHGVIDPIAQLSELALQHKIGLHVDACIGGFMLPWIQKLGYDLPKFDFEAPGVTSISADSHKYGFAAKGSSVILWRTEALRKYQYFAHSTWPGGLFVSPSALGTRAGGSIAAAWAALVSLGENGYLEKFSKIMETVKYIRAQLAKIPGVVILGNQAKPESSLVAFTSTKVNILAVAEYVEKKYGWKLEGQQRPNSIHLTVMPSHFQTKEDFIHHMKDGLQYVAEHPELEKAGTAAMYGMVSAIPSTEITDRFLKTFMSKVYSQPTNQ